jgi:DNA-binding NtrC family response regulator
MAAQVVLLVEDEPIVRTMLAGYLRKAGFAVLTAESGENALAIIRSSTTRLDWLYTDIKLPGSVDGWIVGAEFHLRHPRRPVVYATASAPQSRAQTAQSIFIRKPFDAQVVVDFFLRLAADEQAAPTAEAGISSPSARR